MAQRTYRLSISPEDTPDVRRVLDLDGRTSLARLHEEIGRSFQLPPSKALYAFFLSGRFWDATTAYMDPRVEGRRADKALLFRSGLEVGSSFAYLLGFEVERHYLVQVLAIREVEHPLPAPVLVEWVGEASLEPSLEPATPEQEPPELTVLVKLAEAFLDRDDELEPFADQLAQARALIEPWEADDAVRRGLEPFKHQKLEPELGGMAQAALALRGAGDAAESLLQALAGSVSSFLQLDEWLLARALGTRLLDLPMSLSLVGEVERALSLARTMAFIDPELIQGDIAIILARAGRRDEALAQVEHNLDGARDAALVEAKSGDAYRALGDLPAAEAYYRRSLAVAKTASDRLLALLRIVACLTESGRDAEAAELLLVARKERGEPAPKTVVGRNEPCPCGSAKKYKKCHGV